MKPKDKVLTPVRPNAGLEQAYRAKILRLVDEMSRSVTYWVKAAYRRDEPAVTLLARDETVVPPANLLKRVIAELRSKWQSRFDQGSQDLADYFGQAVHKRSDAQLKAILKKAGFSVPFQMTRAMKDVLQATVHESVNLIKSIPERFFTDVEGAVMRSVQVGRDVGGLAAELEKTYGITRRRAALISRDQNNKATAAMQRARQLELGVEEAIWMHSHAGKVPRPTHVANNGKKYSVREGWFDPDEGRRVFPGELINCRCTARPVIPGFI